LHNENHFAKACFRATAEGASEYKRVKGRMSMEFAIVIVAVIGYLAFRQWLQFNRRTMIHRERLAAIEKGADLPPVELEVRRVSWNVQRLLLLAGLVWVSLGVGTFVTLSALLAHPTPAMQEIPQGLQWIGVAPVCIGLSHLIVYLIGKRKEN
jgi:small-conductance mechanosensitive channel